MFLLVPLEPFLHRTIVRGSGERRGSSSRLTFRRTVSWQIVEFGGRLNDSPVKIHVRVKRAAIEQMFLHRIMIPLRRSCVVCDEVKLIRYQMSLISRVSYKMINVAYKSCVFKDDKCRL